MYHAKPTREQFTPPFRKHISGISIGRKIHRQLCTRVIYMPNHFLHFCLPNFKRCSSGQLVGYIHLGSPVGPVEKKKQSALLRYEYNHGCKMIYGLTW